MHLLYMTITTINILDNSIWLKSFRNNEKIPRWLFINMFMKYTHSLKFHEKKGQLIL